MSYVRSDMDDRMVHFCKLGSKSINRWDNVENISRSYDKRCPEQPVYADYVSGVVLGDRCDIPGRMVEMRLIWIIAVVALAGVADAKTTSDLTELIAENSLVVDSMDLEELVFFVGTKGFDVSREGMVSLEDGQVDLRKYI